MRTLLVVVLQDMFVEVCLFLSLANWWKINAQICGDAIVKRAKVMFKSIFRCPSLLFDLFFL